MKKIVSIIVLLVAVMYSCTEKKEIPTEKANIYFEAVSKDSSGITFSNTLKHSNHLNIIEYLYYYNGGGVAIGDLNNDGLDDIYFTANQTEDKLYFNLGNLKFKDVTKEAGILIDNSWSTGVTMEDVNNDGYLDIYVSKVGDYKGLSAHNLLYINNGDGTFKESATAYGLNFKGFSTQASFFDYDNDGDMDVYLMNHSVHNSNSYGNITKRTEVDSLAGDRLYENLLDQGITKFTDVTQKANIYSSTLGYGLALATADINNDGLIDIYVGNDFHEDDYLYINQGNKTFKESTEDYLQHTARFTMGVDIADINNDLLPDIFTLDMMPSDHEIFLKSGGEDSDKVHEIKRNFGFNTQYARNTLQLNNTNGHFADVALMTNTYATDWSWSTLMEDYDNDGQTDIYVTNGIYKRPNDLDYINFQSNVDYANYDKNKLNELEKQLIDKMPTVKLSNVVFRNKGNLHFERLTSTAGQKPSYSNGAAYSDLDNDGDIDIVVNNINEPATVFENKSPKASTNNYISISLEGNKQYANPTGSKVVVFANNKVFCKELTATRGFQSSSSHKLHFGLGTATTVDSITVAWLDGAKQVHKNIALNQEHIFTRSTNTTTIALNPAERGLTKDYDFVSVHLENNYKDYDREVLIPEKLSAEGPAAVQADFNGDGLEDLFIGGAKYQSASLFFKKADGSYEKSAENVFAKDKILEDVDAIAVDVDNDKDLDLFVLTGGNENAENSDFLEDRIYINDGKGFFRRLPLSLLKTNGGSVSSADFNKDGYMDLFIGSRSIPGNYGLSPFSFILESNGKGLFKIVVKARMGMVTDSQWADMNGDGEIDLVVVGDWMPITVFLNDGKGSFTNGTKQLGLHQTAGMWNSVTVADIDYNGKNDIIAGNTGLNFKIKASVEKPVRIYLDDFDKNGSLDPIIFYDFFGNQVPFASKDKLTTQMPSLKKKFLNYHLFSKISSINDLTDKKIEDILETKTITELRSMAYMNNDNYYTGIPLPKEAQMSTVQDINLTHLDENTTQLVFIGNHLDYTNELGVSDANSGGIIHYTKEDSFVFQKNLPLPEGLNTRKIIKTSPNKYIIISNNDKAYQIDLLKN